MDKIRPFFALTDILKLRSRDAVAVFPDGELDFAYIDAAHDYCSVREELGLYWPKVRSGGLIAGDDFFFPPPADLYVRCHNGSKIEGSVQRAVREFAKEQGRHITVIDAQWILRK